MYPPEDKGVIPENTWALDDITDEQQKQINGIIRVLIPDDSLSLEKRYDSLDTHKQKLILDLVK